MGLRKIADSLKGLTRTETLGIKVEVLPIWNIKRLKGLFSYWAPSPGCQKDINTFFG